MSRIAGIINRYPGNEHRADLKPVVAGLVQSKKWSCRTVERGNASLVWCGWTEPNVAEMHGVTAVVDGIVYNRALLGPQKTDAELIAGLYGRYGFREALEMLNGDFAIALYDSETGTLWLARDRFGVKPLYYVSGGGCFAFASRPRALLGLPGMTRQVNQRFVALYAACHYRYFDNDPEQSPYSEVSQLPASHLLEISTGRMNKSAYWSLQDQPDFTGQKDDLAEQYRDLLLDAVSIRHRASQRPAFTLSGGMDSSSVLSSAVRMTGARQHAFSTVYADKTYDESAEIRSMLNLAVQEWHPVQVSEPDLFGLVQKMVKLHDEPVATATWLSHFLLCNEVAQRGFKGLFGGLGGDELNAGEYEYFLYHFADLRVSGQEERLRQEVEMWVRYHDHPVFRKNPGVMEGGLSRLVDLDHPGRCLPDQLRLHRYSAVLNRDYFDLSKFKPVMDHPFKSYLKNRTFQDIFRETAPCCLRAEDRHATAFEIDHFLPFFDHRLAEFMFRISGTLKIRNGVTKVLLRQAMRGIMPEETRTRIKKTGWNAPAHVWFALYCREQLLDMIHSQNFRTRGIYNLPEVERIVDEHHDMVTGERNGENHMMFIWQIVNLEIWLRGLLS